MESSKRPGFLQLYSPFSSDEEKSDEEESEEESDDEEDSELHEAVDEQCPASWSKTVPSGQSNLDFCHCPPYPKRQE